MLHPLPWHCRWRSHSCWLRQVLASRVDGRRTALHLESQIEKYRTQDSQNMAALMKTHPMEAEPRCGCMEVSGVDVWSVPPPVAVWCPVRSPPTVYTPRRPVTTTSYSRDESKRNHKISERHKFFLICSCSIWKVSKFALAKLISKWKKWWDRSLGIYPPVFSV